MTALHDLPSDLPWHGTDCRRLVQAVSLSNCARVTVSAGVQHTVCLSPGKLQVFAATAAGIYESVTDAVKKMSSGFDHEYHPIPDNVNAYNDVYNKYCELAENIETNLY